MIAFWPRCSGILLTLRTVLTSAVCINSEIRKMKENTNIYLQVVAGASHIYSETMQFREVIGVNNLHPFKPWFSRPIYHVDLKSESYIGKDLAILYLNNSFILDDSVVEPVKSTIGIGYETEIPECK